MSLDGKIALVTGGGSGIGKAIAEAIAGAGAHVAINTRSKTGQAVAKALGGSFYQADLANMNEAHGLGERVLANVSKPGWEQWLARQTMLLNEKRLSPMDPAHRAYLATQMEAFFFGDGGDEPEGWVAPSS